MLREIYLVAVLALLVGGGDKTKSPTLSIELTNLVKGICAFLIIIGHSVIATENTALATFNVGWYCVAIFFFFSGWGLYYGVRTKPDYLETIPTKRVAKVVIPFLTAHIIYYLVKTLFGVRFVWRDFVFGLLGNCNIVDNSWYPVAILIMYIIFWIAFSQKMNDNNKLLLLFILVVAETAVLFLLLGKSMDWWFISNLSFFAGAFLKAKEQKIKNRKMAVVFGIALFFVGYAFVPVCARLLGQYYYVVYIIGSNIRSAGLTIAILFLLCEIGHRPSVFDVLGKYSYEMYLMHGLFIWIGNKLGIRNTIAMIVFATVLTLPTSIVVNAMNTRIMSYLIRMKKT